MKRHANLYRNGGGALSENAEVDDCASHHFFSDNG